MKLKPKQQIVIGFMLFSLFFGAGNLIFPPFLGYQSGTSLAGALIGFIITAVVLPVLGVVIVVKFNGLDQLAGKVNSKFSICYTVLILLAIGPGLGIPRAASVPFDMAIKPYLSENLNANLLMVIYSFVFFALALWLSLTPNKLTDRIGAILTPALLGLLIILFAGFIIKGNVKPAPPSEAYSSNSFLKGFTEGYLTMDTIAALNFGLIISTTLCSMGVKDNKSIVKHTIKISSVAGILLALIYFSLSYIGMATSSSYEGITNGAEILRKVTTDLFGNFGTIILAAIFTLACLTTCVGLITSISKYFSDLFKKVSYKTVAIIISVFAFVICNMGLNMILSISVPILNAIYPMTIVLIVLGFFDKFYRNNKFVYPVTVGCTGIISLIHVINSLIPNGIIRNVLVKIPGYSSGFGWVLFSVSAFVISLILGLIFKPNTKKEA